MNQPNENSAFDANEEPLSSLVKLVERYGTYEVMEAMSIVELFAQEPNHLSCPEVARYDENGQLIYMDRQIMKAKDDETVIHLNGDSLDCQRHNMILVKTKSLKSNT